MKVPFNDLKQQYNEIKEEIHAGLEEVFNRGAFILGEEERSFEKEFAAYCGTEYAVGVNSGTDALFLTLLSLNIKDSDEVILPAHTFIATALSVSYTGAKPVFVDIDPVTYNMDYRCLEDALTERTKVIMPVHLYGQSANVKEIKDFAKKHNLKVVEDACQAHGATYMGNKVGSMGDAGCFSFYPGKSLGAFGDGGMIVTNNEEIYDKAVMLRDYGRVDKYAHKIKGYNSRLDTVQAVVLSAKLKRLDKWNEMRQKQADYYKRCLSDVPSVKIPEVADNRDHVFQTYAVLVEKRDEVCKSMNQKGATVLIHYPIPLHLQEAYQDLGFNEGAFPESERIAKKILSLPMFPHITNDQIDYVCSTLKEIIRNMS